MPMIDSAFAQNLGTGLLLGVTGGALYELLKRKAQNSSGDLVSPEETASMPMANRPVQPPKKKKEKRADLGLGHLVGGLGGAAAGKTLVGKLINRKKSLQLDKALEEREAEFNTLLMQEQSTASGMPTGTLSALNKAAGDRRTDELLTKIASDLFDNLEKKGDFALRELLTEAKKALNIEGRPAYQAMAGAAALGGGAWGYGKMLEKDPNRVTSSMINRALEERLTGKDKNVGPMPIRVESETPEMRPFKPGASSMVDPTRGRDVLDGI